MKNIKFSKHISNRRVKRKQMHKGTNGENQEDLEDQKSLEVEKFIFIFILSNLRKIKLHLEYGRPKVMDLDLYIVISMFSEEIFSCYFFSRTYSRIQLRKS